jgi:hypothetical protein
MRIPGFLVRQFYVSGSLRSTGDGFSLQATNPMGDGTLVGIRRISVDRVVVDPSAISASRDGEDAVYRAADVSAASPVLFRRGDTVTCHVAGHPLAPGRHVFEVELVERDLGELTLDLEDVLRGDG